MVRECKLHWNRQEGYVDRWDPEWQGSHTVNLASSVFGNEGEGNATSVIAGIYSVVSLTNLRGWWMRQSILFLCENVKYFLQLLKIIDCISFQVCMCIWANEKYAQWGGGEEREIRQLNIKADRPLALLTLASSAPRLGIKLRAIWCFWFCLCIPNPASVWATQNDRLVRAMDRHLIQVLYWPI